MDRLAQLGALKTNEWNFLQEQMSRLVQAWKEGDPGDLEKFLPPPGDVLRAITLQELIMTDLEMRWQSGQSVSLDYYVGKYPELGARDELSTKLIFEEYRVRTRYGDAPHLASYRRRFPRQFSELEILIGQQPPPAPAPEPASGLLNPFAGTGTMNNPQVELNGYKLLRRIASGAFADVYEAEAQGGVRAAMKIIRQPLANEDAKRELEALEVVKQLSHTCLVQLRAFWVHEDRLCVVMDLGDCTLRDRLQECRKEGTPEEGIQGIPPQELLAYFRDAAEALDYLHSENILHRDVKPANIVLFKAKRRLSKAGNVEFQARAKLADFGLARLVESARLDASGGGTLAYMAPEACRNRTNPQSDLYSLAASYTELRLGRPLFPYTNMLELTEAHLRETPELSPLSLGEQRVLLRALAKDPEDRFPTCQQFVSALEEVLGSPARPSSRTAVAFAGYRMVRLMGGSARGESWEAVAPDGTHVGLTLLRNQPWTKAVEERRTLQFLRGVEHPNLARLLEVVLVDSGENILPPEVDALLGAAPVTLCLVSELLAETLGQRLDRYEKGMPLRELLGWMGQAAEALDTLRGPYPTHSPPRPEAKRPASRWPFGRGKQADPLPVQDTVTLIHGAISPRSLFMDGNTLKVGDFTSVKLLHSAQGLLGRDDALLPGFVAPELYGKQAHASSDQYSLAITYVELRTGRSPFQSSAPAVLRTLQQEGKLNLKRLPDPEVDVIKRATSLNPAERYPSCRDMVAALEDACSPSGLRAASQRVPPVPPRKPSPASPAVFPAPGPVSPSVPSPEDSGEFLIPSPGAAAVKTLPGAAAKAIGVSETIGHVPPAAGSRDVLQETWNSPPAAEPMTPKKSATDTAKEPPAPAAPKQEARPAPAVPRPSANKKRQRLLATVVLGAGTVALVTIGIILFKQSGNSGNSKTDQTQLGQGEQPPVVPPEVDPGTKPPVTPPVTGPSEEEIRQKRELAANQALEAIRKASRAAEATEPMKQIPKGHPRRREAEAHLRLLQALEAVPTQPELSEEDVTSWLKDAEMGTDLQARLELILAQIGDRAEKNVKFAAAAAKALGDKGRFPDPLRVYVVFVQALGDKHAGQTGTAASKFLEVIAADQPRARVLTTDPRKQHVGETLVAAASDLHLRDRIHQPFQDGSPGTEKAYTLLTEANALLGSAAEAARSRRAYYLALAAWHRDDRTPRDTAFVRQTTQDLMAKRKALEGPLDFCSSFLHVHAASQERNSPEAAAAAVKSYAELVARHKKGLVAGLTPEVLFTQVLKPATGLMTGGIEEKEEATRKAVAAIHSSYARFLREEKEIAAQQGFTPALVQSEILAALRKAVTLERTPERAQDFVRANLDSTTGPVPDEAQEHAEWLVKHAPESSTAHRWLSLVLKRNAEVQQRNAENAGLEVDHFKQIRALRGLRNTTKAGLELLKQPGGAQDAHEREAEKEDLDKAKSTFEELVGKAKERGYALINKSQFYEAVEWALSFKGLDLYAASRTTGLAYSWAGELGLAREAYEAGLEHAQSLGAVWEVVFRTDHLVVLNRLATRPGEEPTLADLRAYADAVAKVAAKLDKATNGERCGAAFWEAANAWRHIGDRVSAENRKEILEVYFKVTGYLEKVCEYAPKSESDALARLNYGTWARTMATKFDPPFKESAAIVRKAIDLLKDADDPKALYHAHLKALGKVAEATTLHGELTKLAKKLAP